MNKQVVIAVALVLLGTNVWAQSAASNDTANQNLQAILDKIEKSKQAYIENHMPPDPSGIFGGRWSPDIKSKSGSPQVFIDPFGGGINTEGKGVPIYGSDSSKSSDDSKAKSESGGGYGY